MTAGVDLTVHEPPQGSDNVKHDRGNYCHHRGAPDGHHHFSPAINLEYVVDVRATL
jgi:hypothetical protein